MKKLVVFCLAALLLLPLLALACGGGGDQTIELSLDDFQAQNNITRSVEVGASGTLTVKLGANPTTGYQWGENAEISNTAVITQTSYNYNEPEDTEMMGAPGTDVWVFDAKAAGSATITFSYSRSFEEGTPATYTLTVNVTVK